MRLAVGEEVNVTEMASLAAPNHIEDLVARGGSSAVEPAVPQKPNQYDVIASWTAGDGNAVLIRWGYYNAKTGKGSGLVKATQKHNAKLPVIKAATWKNHAVEMQGTARVYHGWVNKFKCRRVGPVATAHCVGEVKCPSWVNAVSE